MYNDNALEQRIICQNTNKTEISKYLDTPPNIKKRNQCHYTNISFSNFHNTNVFDILIENKNDFLKQSKIKYEAHKNNFTKLSNENKILSPSLSKIANKANYKYIFRHNNYINNFFRTEPQNNLGTVENIYNSRKRKFN
ncbi:hypothetical protein NUSPORA_03029 [Nucleospora cyclopteri]